MSTSPKTMPALFLGHGSPMMAVQRDVYTERLASLAAELPRPRAILVVSAHWLTRGTAVSTANPQGTIHDFGGFPEELYKIEYPVAGEPAAAERARELIGTAGLSPERGLDHGAWQVLLHMYPEADIPAFQVSIDFYQPPEHHFELGARLRPLRDEGVLILGSGNITHNLSIVDWANQYGPPVAWAADFDARVKEKLVSGDYEALFRYEELGDHGRTAVPAPDHYWPVLYILGAADRERDKLSFVYEGFQHGSISMRGFRLDSN